MMKNFNILFGIVFAATLFILGVYFFGWHKPKCKLATVNINGHKFDADVADTQILRLKGLSGRTLIERNKGMLFVFNDYGKYGFWMKDMKFPIDIIWIKDGLIVGIEKNIAPIKKGGLLYNIKSYYPPTSVNMVFEINAGLSDEYGFKNGDAVQINY